MNTALSAIFSGCEGKIEIRSWQPAGKFPKQKYFDDPEAAEKYARTLDGKEETYYGVGTRKRESGKREDVKELPGLWADFDDSPIGVLREFLDPTIIYETSPGHFHVLWLFKEPLALETPELTASVEAVLRGIARRLGSDPNVCDLPRVLRVPGSMNLKRKARGRVVKTDGPRYAFSDFLDLGLGIPAEQSHASGNGHQPAAPVGPVIQDGQRNTTLASLAGTMRNRGMSQASIEAALLEENRRCSPSPLPEKEVLGIARSISRYPAAGELAQAAAAPGQLFQVLDVARIIRDGIPPIQWDIEEFLVRQTVTYLTGIWKGYKTFLACSWAAALTSGSTFCGLKTTGDHRILFLEGEYPMQIPIRMQRLCLGFQVDPGKVLERMKVIIPRGLFRLEDPSHAAALIEEAKTFGATWVFLDSLRRLTAAKENSSDEMAMVANIGLLPIRDQAGAGVLVLDHPARPWPMGTRQKKLEARGSGDKIAAADVQIHIDNLETSTGKVAAVSVAASRVAPERTEPLYLRLHDSINGGIGFEKTEQPADESGGRPPTAIEKARRVILEEAGRNPGLTYTDATGACVSAGISLSTAKTAWGEIKDRVKGQEGQKPFFNPDPKQAGREGQEGQRPCKGLDLDLDPA